MVTSPVSSGGRAGPTHLFPALPSVDEPASRDTLSFHADDVADSTWPPAGSRSIQGIVVATAIARVAAHEVKMPWEIGPLAPLFGGSWPSIPDLSVHTVPTVGLADALQASQTEKSSVPVVTPLSNSVLLKRRIAAAKLSVPEDELRTRALKQLRVLILLDLTATRLGRSLMNMAGALDETADVGQSIADCFAGKSTGTLLKRVGSLWHFSKWLMREGGNRGSPFAQEESEVYCYVCQLRETSSAPTKASHFLEALRFAAAILKFEKVDIDQVLSTRICGAAHAMFLKKRKLKQAPHFTVEAVQALELVCLSDERDHCRLIAGSLLFCILACVRWGDSMNIERCWTDSHEDVVLVEAETSRHKTSKSKEAKTRLLPYTALGTLFADESWGEQFIRDRQLCFGNRPAFFLPSWNESACTWASSPMTSGECACWIRELLEPFLGLEKAAEFSSHSCKATVITWAGMTTLFTREERTLLGHHVEAATRSNVTYSRDAQILLQFKVARMVAMLKDGTFDPDASRATRLSAMLKDQEALDVQQPVPAQQDELDQSGEEHGESDGQSEDVEPYQVGSSCLTASTRGTLPEALVSRGVFSDVFSGIVHVGNDFHSDRLLCGRLISMNLKPVPPEEIDANSCTFCIQCNAIAGR